MKCSIIIIGAGPCGLVALKEMLEKGHNAILLEKSHSLGGTFATTAVYPSLHFTISNWAMAFSDFPGPERLCYPTGVHYLEYLRAYAKHFRLGDHIRYRSEVRDARYTNQGRWELEVSCDEDIQPLKMTCNALIVATGANQVANATPPALSDFQGKVIHSVEYNDAFKRDVAKKQSRVLVVRPKMFTLHGGEWRWSDLFLP